MDAMDGGAQAHVGRDVRSRGRGNLPGRQALGCVGPLGTGSPDLRGPCICAGGEMLGREREKNDGGGEERNNGSWWAR